MGDLFDAIYLKATGYIDPEKDDVPIEIGVEDTFIEGGKCDKAYSVVFNIKSEVEETLHDRFKATGVPEDKAMWQKYDTYLSEIVDKMTDIQDILCERMYLYGKRAYALGYDKDLELEKKQ